MVNRTRIEIDDEVWATLQQRAAPFVDTPNDVLRRLLGLSPNGQMPKSGTAKARRKRLPRGERTPQEEFYVPVLRAVESLAGSARVADILDLVEQQMSGRLRPVDLDILNSGGARWRKTAQFARNDMVNKMSPPLLNPSAPHGWWEITEAGHQYLREVQKGQ